MITAKKDENSRPAMIAASNLDGATIIALNAEVNHQLIVSDGVGGADLGNNSDNAMLDENGTPVLTAVSSAGDGAIVELYADPISKALLVNSQ